MASCRCSRTRLEQKGKTITTISLAERLQAALDEQFPLDQQIEAERSVGIEATIETVHEVLSRYRPLDELVAAAVPSPCEPTRDLCFIVRVGALFPFYRTFSLLEQLKGKIPDPDHPVLPGRARRPRGPPIHGRPRRRAQLPSRKSSERGGGTVHGGTRRSDRSLRAISADGSKRSSRSTRSRRRSSATRSTNTSPTDSIKKHYLSHPRTIPRDPEQAA